MAHTVVVNGKKKSVEAETLSYEAVVHLAFENPPSGPNVVITITYKYVDGDRAGGSLLPGGTLVIKTGMVIDVTATDRS